MRAATVEADRRLGEIRGELEREKARLLKVCFQKTLYGFAYHGSRLFVVVCWARVVVEIRTNEKSMCFIVPLVLVSPPTKVTFNSYPNKRCN